MAQPFYKTSNVTGRTYDLFNICRILNPRQSAFYMSKGVPLEHIEVSEDRKTGEPVLVMFFDKKLSYPAYDEWCKRKEQKV